MTVMCSSRIYVFNDFQDEFYLLRMLAMVVYLIFNGTPVSISSFNLSV